MAIFSVLPIKVKGAFVQLEQSLFVLTKQVYSIRRHREYLCYVKLVRIISNHHMIRRGKNGFIIFFYIVVAIFWDSDFLD